MRVSSLYEGMRVSNCDGINCMRVSSLYICCMRVSKYCVIRDLGLKLFCSTIIGHGSVQTRVVKGLLTLIHQER